jgi:tol-pal system protein YbgF
MRLVRGRIVAVSALLTTACLASQQDVARLDGDIQSMRAQQMRTDTVRTAQLNRVIANLGAVNDSLQSLSARLTKAQGDMRGDLYVVAQQLVAIQELTGASQQRLQELRSALEQRQQETQAQQATQRGDTSAAARAGAPGPNQLYQSSLDQLRRGSASTARSGLQELLKQYPTSDVAPAAQFYLGEAYGAEGNADAADSAYATVVAKYPTSAQAPTALYKRALQMEGKGNLTGARAALTQIVQKYPRSDEAALARERLKTMK